MRLNRRDVIAALAASGVAFLGSSAIFLSLDDNSKKEWEDKPITESEVTGMVAAAKVLYPSEVENIEKFVTEYIRGQSNDNPEKIREMSKTITYLNKYSKSWYKKEFSDLDKKTRNRVFKQMDADSANPDPEGSDVERIRYYIINELLFALYTTPTGSRLVGLENPQGYPGGLKSYQLSPQK